MFDRRPSFSAISICSLIAAIVSDDHDRYSQRGAPLAIAFGLKKNCCVTYQATTQHGIPPGSGSGADDRVDAALRDLPVLHRDDASLWACAGIMYAAELECLLVGTGIVRDPKPSACLLLAGHLPQRLQSGLQPSYGRWAVESGAGRAGDRDGGVLRSQVWRPRNLLKSGNCSLTCPAATPATDWFMIMLSPTPARRL